MNRKSKEKEQLSLLKERIGLDLYEALNSKKKQLKKIEVERAEKENQRVIEERKRKEANKSFEELLTDSDMDWKKYK